MESKQKTQNQFQLDPITSGLLYTHMRINDTTQRTLQNSAFLFALIEMLDEKGIISIKDLDERKKAVADRLVKKFVEKGIGLLYQSEEEDKYAFEGKSSVPCEERLNTCKAVCCKLPFALSHQDIDEGIVKWEFGRPYVIAHGEDGYCVHLDKTTYKCTLYENRPVPCRGFDCQNCKNWKIWKDQEGKQLHPDFEKSLRETVEMFYGKKNRM